MNSWLDWSTNRIKGEVIGEVRREAPAQTELRPTCAGPSRDPDLRCRPHEFLARLVDQSYKG
jgi:hypothetical protein